MINNIELQKGSLRRFERAREIEDQTRYDAKNVTYSSRGSSFENLNECTERLRNAHGQNRARSIDEARMDNLYKYS